MKKISSVLLVPVFYWGCVVTLPSQTTTQSVSTTPAAAARPVSPLELSETLAVKLYPATTDADSPLVHEINQLYKIAEMYGFEIHHSKYRPLLLAIIAANALGIESNWSQLTEQEKSDVFQEIMVSLKSSDTEFNATYLTSIRGSSEAVPDVNAQMVKKQSDEIADLKQVIGQQRRYIQGLYADDAAAKDALGQAQYSAWQAWQAQQQQNQQRTYQVQDSDGNSGQVIVTPQ